MVKAEEMAWDRVFVGFGRVFFRSCGIRPKFFLEGLNGNQTYDTPLESSGGALSNEFNSLLFMPFLMYILLYKTISIFFVPIVW